ncbi:extracellular solute-binding protein [Kutzneria viridogrisea]|uniref:Probable sugar-binding periplasmic protein n=1 Tax=Kutzneria viridogrisea TaxID=47990 RepID=A0ABR6BW64_9PSEU|nr:multiple sugar transport system substrate-binding protein [Kutzneria viridogrisea]
MRTRRGAALISAATAGVLLSACTAGGGSNSGAAAAFDPNQQLTLTVYSNFADRELGVLNKALDGFRAKYPNIKVNSQGNQDDDKITQSIRSGNPPDVAISFATDNIGQFCSSKAWQDLKPYLDRDKLDLNQIPQAVRDYTSYQGTRCAMPMLADVNGLYYNKDLFAQAGITAAPKNMTELFEDAKKLTQRNPDGSIKTIGFIPQIGFYANHPQIWAPQFGAKWVDGNGKSDLATDPGWQELFTFQKKLVDFYGWENLQKFTAGLGQEYSADHGFNKGQVAMMFDGEYRTAFINNDAPKLNYGTAPSPVADDRANLYGGGYTTGTIVGIPKGAKNSAAGWELVKYLSTDTGALVQLANGLNNVPSTKDALHSPDLKLPPQFKTFLDIFDNPNLASNPASPNGGAYIKTVEDFANSWQSGKVTDLKGELAKVDKTIDDAKALGGN